MCVHVCVCERERESVHVCVVVSCDMCVGVGDCVFLCQAHSYGVIVCHCASLISVLIIIFEILMFFLIFIYILFMQHQLLIFF